MVFHVMFWSQHKHNSWLVSEPYLKRKNLCLKKTFCSQCYYCCLWKIGKTFVTSMNWYTLWYKAWNNNFLVNNCVACFHTPPVWSQNCQSLLNLHFSSGVNVEVLILFFWSGCLFLTLENTHSQSVLLCRRFRTALITLERHRNPCFTVTALIHLNFDQNTSTL